MIRRARIQLLFLKTLQWTRIQFVFLLVHNCLLGAACQRPTQSGVVSMTMTLATLATFATMATMAMMALMAMVIAASNGDDGNDGDDGDFAGNVGICVCRLHPPKDRHLCLSPTC